MRLISERDVPVRTRDGVVLATDILRPDTDRPVPVILKRTPYDKRLVRVGDLTEPVDLVERGYAVLAQDVRGRFASGGRFEPFIQEIADGFDAVEWAAAQPWSDGHVVMHGASYLGATQWLAAMAQPTSLRAITPNITSSDYHEGWAYQGGAFQLGFAVYWAHSDFTVGHSAEAGGGDVAARREAMDDLVGRYRQRPLADHPLVARWAPFFAAWLEHADRDDYWARMAPRDHWADVLVPALNIGGWYDVFVERHAGEFRRNAPARWQRGGTRRSAPDRGAVVARTIQSTATSPTADTGCVQPPPARTWRVITSLVRSLDRTPTRARKCSRGGSPRPPVRDGPQRVARRRRLAAARRGDPAAVPPLRGEREHPSRLGDPDFEPPADAEPADAYVADPLDPVPSMGGPTLTQVGGVFGWNAGPYDQSPIEDRPDVLVYTSEPLRQPLEVIGPIELVLYASSSAPDTDLPRSSSTSGRMAARRT